MVTSKPGWYRDPKNPTNARYWDGAKWTNHMKEIKAEVTPGAAPSPPPAHVDATPAIAFKWKETQIGGQPVLAPKSYAKHGSKSAAGQPIKVKEGDEFKLVLSETAMSGINAEPDYGRARRKKTKGQMLKVLKGTTVSLAAGIAAGVLIGVVFSPLPTLPPVTQIVAEAPAPAPTE